MTETTTPLGLTLLLSMGLLLLVVPRRYALLPVLVLACYMPIAQAVMVGGLHFYMLRILLIFGWLRLLIRGELRWRGLTAIDKAFLGWVLSGLILGSLLWGDMVGLVNRLGYAYDAIGVFFLFRALLRDQEDIIRAFKQLAILASPLAVFMVFEKFTGRNPFFVLGGVPEFDQVREGVVRSQAAFGHSILAGVFGATLVPYFVALWVLGGRSRWLAALGAVASMVITVSAGSSGPVMAYGAGALGLMMWRFRYRMRLVRWGIVAMLAGLQAAMKVPVWWAISHLSLFSGNTAFYRSNLIDKFIMNFADWWLVGTRSTQTWGFLVGQGPFQSADITNMFVRVGVDGGLLTLVLFLLVIVRCFRGVGVSFRAATTAGESRSSQFTIWALGAALFTHIVAFFDVQYFDQNFVTWCLLLAMVSCATKVFSTVPQPVTASREVSDGIAELPSDLQPEAGSEKPEAEWWLPDHPQTAGRS